MEKYPGQVKLHSFSKKRKLVIYYPAPIGACCLVYNYYDPAHFVRQPALSFCIEKMKLGAIPFSVLVR